MKKIKRKNLIIFIILFLILFIIACVLIGFFYKKNQKSMQERILKEKKQQVEQYTRIDDFKSIEEVLIYLDSEFISQEDANVENVSYIVKAKLKYGLDLNNKNYYDKLIEYSAAASKYKSFYIIDEDNKIEILVLCNNSGSISSYYINNEKFYFEKLSSKENITDYKKIDNIKITTMCKTLQDITTNNWVAANINLGTKDSIYNGYDIYFDEGYELKKINGKIYNIVFTEKYSENVIENINVNTSFEKIKEKLKDPQFETTKCIGYKTEKFYIFFSKGEISVYPIVTYSSDEVIKIIENYKNSNEIGKFVTEIKNIWADYDIYKVEKNTELLQYTLKGIVFKYENTAQDGVTIYNNYVGKVDENHTLENVLNKEIDLPQNINFINKDLVFEEESNRLFLQIDYTPQDNFATDPVLNTSTKFKTYLKQNALQFIAINKQYPNSELRENLNYGIWLDDTQFIYSVYRKGIYKYNVVERKYSTVVEGKDDFKLIKIQENKLYYDEKEINL